LAFSISSGFSSLVSLATWSGGGGGEFQRSAMAIHL